MSQSVTGMTGIESETSEDLYKKESELFKIMVPHIRSGFTPITVFFLALKTRANRAHTSGMYFFILFL